MEIALEAGIPTYSGGFGVLAGDTLRSAADLGVPMVAQRAHRSAKERLLYEIATRAGVTLDPGVFTIGFARRAAAL